MAEHALRTVAEVARELRLSRVSVYRKIASGELDALRIGDAGPLRVEASSVDRLLRPAAGTSDQVEGRTAAQVVRPDRSVQGA